MTLKVVNNSDPGTADTVGGNDWDQMAAIINGTDSTTNILRSPYTYLVYKSGSTYYAQNGATKAIDYSGSVADVVIQSAITAIAALSRGGTIMFSGEDFPITTPLLFPGNTSSGKVFSLVGLPQNSRVFQTVFSAASSFPNNRYLFETTDVDPASAKSVSIFLKDFAAYNINFATLNAGLLKYEIDNTSVTRAIQMDNIYGQYLWRGIHLIGGVWWGVFNNVQFNSSNTSFTGDADIIMEQGSHTTGGNPWPKFNKFTNTFIDHGGGTMTNSLKMVDGGYNTFDNYDIEGSKYTQAPWALTGQCTFNNFQHINFLDAITPTPDVRVASLYLTGSNCYYNIFRNSKLPQYPYSVAIKSGAFRNDIELTAFWGTAASVDDSGSGIENVIRLTPSATTAATAQAKITTTGGAGNLRVIDARKGAVTQGTSTQSGDSSTTAFNIAHGCFATPGFFVVHPTSADARGTPSLSATSTNIVLTYPVAPPTGSSNLTWEWKAELTY